jgi:ubiquinone/menaquinone biosynthesis C-methylase UbiE
MNTVELNEQLAEKAFSSQSVIFDKLYAHNAIVSYKRDRVRRHVLQYLQPGAAILELNSGTGDDALFFAKLGYRVHATDISVGMQAQLVAKARANQMQHLISNELCSYTQLQSLKNKGPYDHIFSNFAGLNCTGDLDKVLASFESLLKPGGYVTLVVLPKFCLWEALLIFKGKFRTATRRMFKKNGVKAHVEGTNFTYNPSYIVKQLQGSFKLLKLEGLCTIVPPSYIENFAGKYPVIYRTLCTLEDKFKGAWPWRLIGDYYIITLRKRTD